MQLNSERSKNTQQSSQRKKKQVQHVKAHDKKDNSNKEDLRFFMNQVDEKKFIKKPPKFKKVIKQSLESSIFQDDEIIQDEFLNQNEFSEIKGNYDDYGLGDIVLVFPNPDFNQQNRYVTFYEAEKHYDKVLTVTGGEIQSKAEMQKERDSFLYAFLTLNHYVANKEEKLLEKQKKKLAKKMTEKVDKQQTQLDISNELKKEEKDDQKKDEKDDEKKDEKDELLQTVSKKKKKKELTSYQKYLEIETIFNKNKEEQDFNEKRQKVLEQKHNFLEEFNEEKKYEETGTSSDLFIDPIKELLKVDLKDTKQFSKVRKSWCKGQYLKNTKKQYNNDSEWICTNSPPKDYLTLVRFTVMSKLTRNGRLHTRTFISSDGTALFMVLKANRAVAMRQAEDQKMTKQLELGYADLFSLEPCDTKFRPLRLKTYIRDYQNDETVKKLLDKILQNELAQQQSKGIDDRDKDDYQNDLNQILGMEDKARLIYQRVQKWNDIELRVNIIRKQQEVDQYMIFMAKFLNFDMSQENVELIDDTDVSREEWEPYYVYMVYIIDYMKQMEKIDKYTEVQYNQAFLYKLIFRKALGDANQVWFEQNQSLFKQLSGQFNILKTLWDRLDVPPMSPYTDFFNPKNDASSSMWRKCEINEKGLRSEFSNMEKIRITNTIVLRNINILKLIKLKMANAYLPLHDLYQLQGIRKETILKPLQQAGLMNLQPVTAGDEHLKKLFLDMMDEADPTDFDQQSLEDEAKFNILIPWSIPIDTMRDYFGEKVALYFDFLRYYTKQLWYMAIMGIITQGILKMNAEVANITITLFSIIIIMWSTFFIEFWKREQVLFSVQFGQSNFEEDEAERPAFHGKYIRSITNDNLNEEYYSPFVRKMKMLLSLAISFIIIGMVIACVFGIFLLREYLNKCGCVHNNRIIIDQFPAILNSIQIQIFNMIYQDLGMRFNNYENHKISSSYENSLIAKVFIFMFINTFNSFFIISFMNIYFETLNLCRVDSSHSNCFTYLQTQMTTVFLVTFISIIPEVATPFILSILKKKTQEQEEKHVIHPFNHIDQFIEEQFALQPYDNDEIDGTVKDYMELVIQFSFLALFGLAFPASFLLAFVTNATKIQVNKLKLSRFSRRPFPQGASSIGNWLIILEVVTFLGIFSNAGLIVYTSGVNDNNSSQITLFSILIISFLATKYFIRFIIPDSPDAAIVLTRRHKYSVDRVVKGFTKTGSKSYKSANVNLNIGGLIYQDMQIRMNKIMQEQKDKIE